MPRQEGFVKVNDYNTRYVVYGDLRSDRPAILVLHGGPGYPHYYLEELAALTESGYAVVLYDQLGCGQSDRPRNPDLWTIERFVQELAAVRQWLNLKTVHLLGHSWGGALALEYLFTKPEGVDKLILASPLIDSRIWVAECARLKNNLPSWAASQMHQHEVAGTTNSFEYEQAYAEFKSRFICRLHPYPRALVQSDSETGYEVYATMWGPSETCITGSLKDWTALDRLPTLTTPTLLTSGTYDEVTPKQIQAAQQRLTGARWVCFEHSAHVAHLEEPAKYLATVANFLNE